MKLIRVLVQQPPGQVGTVDVVEVLVLVVVTMIEVDVLVDDVDVLVDVVLVDVLVVLVDVLVVTGGLMSLLIAVSQASMCALMVANGA